MEKILIATHNPGKIKEFREILTPLGIEVTSAADFDLPEPAEDGDTFEANALIKAEAACQATGLPALADDSGLCVEGLKGAPGIYSARWAGPEKDFKAAMQRVQDGLGESENRAAKFVAVLAMSQPDGSHKFFRGESAGSLIWPPRGERGFGYDPMFQPEGYDITFAEMDANEKHKISHRARALKLFLNSL